MPESHSESKDLLSNSSLNDFELDICDPDLDVWFNEEGGLTADALDFLHDADHDMDDKFV